MINTSPLGKLLPALSFPSLTVWRTSLLAVLFGATLLNLTAADARRAMPLHRRAATHHAADHGPKSEQRSDILAYRFDVGAQSIYKLDYASVSAADFGALFQNQQNSGAGAQTAPSGLTYAIKTTVQGEWEVTVLAKQEDGVLVRYRLCSPTVHLDVNGQEPVAQCQALQQDLSRDTYAVVDLRGKVVSVRLDPAMGSISQSYARTLLALTQCVLPDAPSPRLLGWQTREEDPNGAYCAQYSIQHPSATGVSAGVSGRAPSAMTTVRKTITCYLPPESDTNSGERTIHATVHPQGSLVARLDRGAGRLISLTGTETNTQVFVGKTVAHAQTVLRLEYARTERPGRADLTKLQDAEAARAKTVAASVLSALPSRKEAETIVQRKRLGAATLESLLAELGQAERVQDRKADDTPLYLNFKALIYVHPKVSARLGEILAAADSSGLTMRLLPAALSAVGNPEAQSALISAIHARSTELPALMRLVPALGAVEAPTTSAEEALHALTLRAADSDIASMAQLSLGIMAHRLAAASPQRAEKIVSEMMTALISSSSSMAERRRLLLALGNAGSARALPVIARFVHTGSPDLRGSALIALRGIVSPRADTLIADRLRSDPDAGVRMSAAFALTFRPMRQETFVAQKRALLLDRSANVRRTVLENLWKARGDYPEVRTLVQIVRSTDAAQDLRKWATELLAQEPHANPHSAPAS